MKIFIYIFTPCEFADVFLSVLSDGSTCRINSMRVVSLPCEHAKALSLLLIVGNIFHTQYISEVSPLRTLTSNIASIRSFPVVNSLFSKVSKMTITLLTFSTTVWFLTCMNAQMFF